MKPTIFLLFFLLFNATPSQAQGEILSGRVLDITTGLGLLARIEIASIHRYSNTNLQGVFQLNDLPKTSFVLKVQSLGYRSKELEIRPEQFSDTLIVPMIPTGYDLTEVEIVRERSGEAFSVGRLKAVEGAAIYAGKKTEVIQPEKIAMNKATNNARQVFARIPGLNIWESDGGGLQLGIGGRGLSPNRNSNFNVRQNGYDISADALGYPESYYTPPVEATERIEVVRGAASLQYGTQFGGLVNFVKKRGRQGTPFEFISRNTAGSWKFFNTFNSIGGNLKKLNYYAYYQYKRGDGWRPNSAFQSHAGFASLIYRPIQKLELGLEYTRFSYLAQQPGGLTDAQFLDNPRQSLRSRNWFKVDWNLAALTIDIKATEKTRLNFRTFLLYAGRKAVGILERINEIDRGQNRDLLDDTYLNAGAELRFVQRFRIKEGQHTFLSGLRVYGGQTLRKQGFASNGSGADFNYLDPSNPGRSDYRFPGFNFAWFTEQVFNVLPGLSITPGIRTEYIYTAAEGRYNLTLRDFAGNLLSDTLLPEQRDRRRGFVLLGLGIAYKPIEAIELYGNFSQNYRSITFSDLRVVNPNFRVDPEIQDEKGFNADLGLRGTHKNIITYDLSGFVLAYNNRIGQIFLNDTAFPFLPYRYRTNIGRSLTAGVEAFAEMEFLHWLRLNPSKYRLSLFINTSVIYARYTQSKDPSVEGRQVELVPPFLLRTGITAEIYKAKLSVQFSYVRKHYTDASNAEFSSTAVNGIIPSYYVMDLSVQYPFRWFQLEAGINNLTNNRYFTRRADAYPGPGIIPSDALSFYVGLQFKIAADKKRDAGKSISVAAGR